ncbi:MAG: hypothetical protein HFI29_11860 [Lachnospiraceae bacterium]|jgi:hypothetical protein|nr:hypothetical protein [Lachnospiraceae bacterium]
MAVIGGQSAIHSRLTFGTHLEQKPGKSHKDSTKESFLKLLKHTGQEQECKDKEARTESEAAVEEAKECVKNYGTTLIKEILYGTSNAEYWAEKKKHKKYQLFRADNGVFGDKTLEELAVPSDNPKATWNSAQSKKLTKEQARHLKEIYNVSHLSNEEFCGILMELVDNQVLSREEAEKLSERRNQLSKSKDRP